MGGERPRSRTPALVNYTIMDREPLAEALFAAFPPVPTEAWEAKIKEDLRGASYEEALVWEPWEGFAVAPYYRAEDLADVRLAPSPPAADVARWQIRQDVRHGDVGEASRIARQALDGGAEAVGFRLDAEGRRGVPVRTAADVRRLLDGLDPGRPLHFEVGRTSGEGRLIAETWADVAGRRGASTDGLRGSILLAEPDGRATTDVQARGDEAAALVRWAIAEAPRLRVLGTDVRPYADATPDVQIGRALADVSDTLADTWTERGLTAWEVAARMHLAVPVGASFLLEIAKLRALRALVRRVVSVYARTSGAESEPPGEVPITAFTTPRTSSEADVHLNLVHGTVAAVAALVGGADVLVVEPFNAALGPPSDAAYRLARGTGLVLRHEARFGAAPDPAAGAYYVEALTDRLARAAWEAFRREEGRGKREGGMGERERGGRRRGNGREGEWGKGGEEGGGVG